MKKFDDSFTLDAEQGSALIERLKVKAITDDDYALLIKIIECYFWLILSLREAKISMRRFKEMIFGSQKKPSKNNNNNNNRGEGTEPNNDKPTTASSDNNENDGDHSAQPPHEADKTTNTSTPPPGADSPTEQKPPQKGHGRLGSDAYTGASDVHCRHQHYFLGMPCPLGNRRCGTLHTYPDGLTITITGCPPLKATRYRIEKFQCSGCRTIFSADLPAGVSNKEKYSPDAKAIVVVTHYSLAVPFNRFERFQQMMGTPVPDATQWDLVEQVADCAYPIYDHLIYLAAQAYLIYQDDTWVRVLSLMQANKEADDKARKGMYSTGLVTQTGERTLVLFFSGRRHAGENLDQLLLSREDGQGAFIKMSDPLNANNISVKTEEMIESNCNVHALRKFTEIEDFFPQAAREIIDRYKIVFANERRAKADNLSDQERLEFHKKHSGPQMTAIYNFVKQQLDDKLVEPKSSLGKAYQYLLNHWQKLTEFLRTPGVPLDNNTVERALKWMIQVRNNSRFYATEHGAYVGSLLISLIATCYHAKVNPVDYLTALQQHRSAVFKSPERWLPWNYHLNAKENPIGKPALSEYG